MAKSHQVLETLVGMPMSGKIVAIALTALQMGVGCIYLAQALAINAPIIAGCLLIIGLPLSVLWAIVIERFTVGALLAIQVSNDQLRKLEVCAVRFDQLPQRARTERTLHEDKRIATVVVVASMILPAVIGLIFWLTLFTSVGVWGYPLSLICAAVTELYRQGYKFRSSGRRTPGQFIS
jgi:hypothetical protein